MVAVIGSHTDCKFSAVGYHTDCKKLTIGSVQNSIKFQDFIHVKNDEIQFELGPRRCTIVVAPEPA